jgi:hypothetical protein
VDAVITLPLVLPPTVLGYYLLVVLGTRSSLGGLAATKCETTQPARLSGRKHKAQGGAKRNPGELITEDTPARGTK